MNRTITVGAAATAALLLVSACALNTYTPPPPREVLMQPGVSQPLALYRTERVTDVEYHLLLDLTGTDSIRGQAAVFFDHFAPPADVILDYRGLALDSVRANGRALEEVEWENGHVLIPRRYVEAGENQLILHFTSAMAPSGASVIRYTESAQERADTAAAVYLYSLLVPADANQLFPSFDQPNLKAFFSLDAVVPPGWSVLSNGPVERVAESGGNFMWSFAPTEPISTYLFAFAAGPWQVAAEAAAPEGEQPMSLYFRASQADDVDADTLLAVNRRALEWLERYFWMEYPFSKFDMLLAPAFPFGGMEHPGAIFYNESRFVFREPPTLTDRLGRAATIYHEVAHQWFGDLVTMEWFDDLWLKEGFSTYMAAKMQEELNPGTGAWKTFYLRNKPLAYGVDATSGTTPVWQSLENLDLAKSAYGPIVYNKAPSILKQLEFLVGEAAFQSGLQSLLREHAFGNITWVDLLVALERSSGQPLAAFGEHYILRPGMPVIETVLRLEGDTIAELALVQRPARELPGDPGGAWPGRVLVRLGYDDRDSPAIPVTLTGEATVVEEARGLPAPAWVFPNEGDYGYGMFLLDERSADALAERVVRIGDDLLRAMVWGALWDLVGQARFPPERFLELAMGALPHERDEQIGATLLGRASTALLAYLPPGGPETERLQRELESLLVHRMSDPGLPYGQRKASLDGLFHVVRSPAAQDVVLDLLAERWLFDGEPLRQPSRWAAVQALVALDHPAADSLLQAERVRDTSPEAGRRAFVAGAAVPAAQVKADYFRRYLEDPELNEEWVTASLGAFNHHEHAELTLPFLRPALEQLPWIQRNRRIFFLPQWINSFIGGQREREALEIVDAYLAETPDLPQDLRLKVLQARDGLERVVRIREGMAERG